MSKTLSDNEIPEGWRVLWCNFCLTSVSWMDDDARKIDQFDNWHEVLNWTIQNTEHTPERHGEIKNGKA